MELLVGVGVFAQILSDRNNLPTLCLISLLDDKLWSRRTAFSHTEKKNATVRVEIGVQPKRMSSVGGPGGNHFVQQSSRRSSVFFRHHPSEK